MTENEGKEKRGGGGNGERDKKTEGTEITRNEDKGKSGRDDKGKYGKGRNKR